MRLPASAPFSIVVGAPAWRRCAFDQAALVGGDVQLGWVGDATPGEPEAVADAAGAGLAFDPDGLLYHSVPAAGRIERLLWARFDANHPQRGLASVDFLGAPVPPAAGEFVPVEATPPSFVPRALACDPAGHLYALAGAAVVIVDARARRVLRSERVGPGAVDIAWHDGWLYGLSAQPPRLWRLSATRPLAVLAAGLAGPGDPARLAVAPDGRLLVLDRAHAADAALYAVAPDEPGTACRLALGGDEPLAFASDLECVEEDGRTLVVVARRRNEDFVRVDLSTATPALAEPLGARGYDGLGIARTPDGRVAYWTAKGVRHALAARPRYLSRARVTGFRFDSGRYGNRWGRLLLDACLPAGTHLHVHCLSSDAEDDLPAPAVRTPPFGETLAELAQAEATPLPPTAWLPASGTTGQPLVRRSDGTEQPWPAGDDGYATFEAPVLAPPGRYLWVVLDLAGNATATPRVRALRAEHAGHDWLRRLPALYSRQEPMREFLQHYLEPLAGLHEDVGRGAAQRHALLRPASAPAPVLAWLAAWVGLVLDERWSEAATRALIAEAMALWRARGTPGALRRMLEIVAGTRVLVLEAFRFRGYGGSATARDDVARPVSVLGVGLRVGGAVGQAGPAAAGGAVDSFERHAHRFTVIVLGRLDADREAALRHLLEVHRPAHTLFDLCTLGTGMRVGLGLHVALTSVVGPSGGFGPWVLGAGPVGRDRVVGRPARGLRPGSTRVGAGSRLG